MKNISQKSTKKFCKLSTKLSTILISVISIAAMFLMTACARNRQAENTIPTAVPVEIEYPSLDCGYSVSHHPLTNDQNFFVTRFSGKAFYYLSYDSGELVKYDFLANAAVNTIDTTDTADRYLSLFAFDSEENILFLMGDRPASEQDSDTSEQGRDASAQNTDINYFLRKYDTSGELLFDIDITKELRTFGEFSAIYEMAVGADGNLYLAADDSILILNSEATPIGKIDTGAGYVTAFVGGKDNLYAAYLNDSAMLTRTKLAAIDLAAKKLLPQENFPALMPNVICRMDDHSLLLSNYESAYTYDLDTEKTQKLFDWLDYDINGSNLERVTVLEDSRIVAFLRDWTSQAAEFSILSRKNSLQAAEQPAGATTSEPPADTESQSPEKTIITLGTAFGVDPTLQKAVSNFNRSNPSYRVEIKNYVQGGDIESGRNRLNLDLLSDESPDIIALTNLNVRALASKGIFEDLAPYLEQSSVLDRSDYFESVLKSVTYGDRLITIPPSFLLNVLVGKSADFGEKTGWTLSEMAAYGDAHPHSKLLQTTYRFIVTQTLLAFNGELFYNPETAECHFDSPEFLDLLRMIAAYPDWDDYVPDAQPLADLIADGKVLLENAYLMQFEDIQLAKAHFNESACFIGYPNPKSKRICLLSPDDSCYAISSKSTGKEGAWAFLEYLLSTSSDDIWYFPSRKSDFEKRARAACSPFLLDENGEPQLDQDGEPVPQIFSTITTTTNAGESWSYTYRACTQEEVDLLLELINSSERASDFDTKILNIILEEVNAYAAGDKSAEAVADIIQNRVKLYLNENR